ncbi:MAG TPA: ChaN family lipoprotein [Longimicrobiales bacterium]|nr:ChaN family lipoprotein [Longimicrobiales bacterium]
MNLHSRRTRTLLLAVASMALPACMTGAAQQPTATAPVPAQPGAHAAIAGSGHVPHRVYDVAAASFIDFETLAVRASSVDVVYFGEQHGHVPGHRLQHALLEAVGRRTDATLSMEMFERDVADIVAGYAAGRVDLARFLERSRPWPRFFPDYHPLVEEARGRGWPVVAANVPRPLANRIAQEGVALLDGLPAAERAHAAADIQCPDDDYRSRFVEQMTRHPSGHGEPDPAADAIRHQRYYESQCVKDETMAESIVAALAGGAPRPVIHVTGAFHTDHGDGIPVRVLRRDPSVSSFSVTVVPVADLDELDPAAHAGRADYLLFTLATP